MLGPLRAAHQRLLPRLVPQLLRWNDELPFIKFAISADERPVLTAELPVATLDRDALGVALARLVTVCDLLLDDSLKWLHPGAKAAPTPTRPSRHGRSWRAMPTQLGELTAPAPDPGQPVVDEAPEPAP